MTTTRATPITTDDPTSYPLITGPLLTPEEVADMLRLSPRTLEDWRSGGGASNTPLAIRIGGKVVYRLSDVNAYLADQVAAAEARRIS